MLRRLNLLYHASQVEYMQNESDDAARAETQDCEALEGDLRAEYLAAVQANTAAKEYYDEVVTRRCPEYRSTEHEKEIQDPLNQHLELLRSQQRHAHLVDLQDKLTGIKHPPDLEAVGNSSTATGDRTEIPNPGSNLVLLSAELGRSIQALELAVVQAHHEAKKERMLLDRAKSATTDIDAATMQNRLRALSAVREELTAWLEQGLAKCQEDNSLSGAISEVAAADDEDWERKIDEQYEQYLQARKRLTACVTDMQNPLSDKEQEATEDGASSEQRNPESFESSEATGIVRVIETRVLPSMQQQKMLQAQLEATEEQLRNETATMTSMLDRLRDESQLLPAFPVLSHSGRFEHATLKFGKTQSLAEDGVDGATSKQLEPWLFAARAADASSNDRIQMDMQQGNEAMKAVRRSLAELRLLEDSA